MNTVNFKLIKGDITVLKVDAVVNAANTTLLGGGGVDGAIHRRAGAQLLSACRKLNGCPTGEAKLTPGFALPAKYIIHTPGPIWQGGSHNEIMLLRQCYQNSLKLSAAYACKSIAFPAISSGVYHFPVALAAATAVTAVQDYCKERHYFPEIILVAYNAEVFIAYKHYLEQNPDGSNSLPGDR